MTTTPTGNSTTYTIDVKVTSAEDLTRLVTSMNRLAQQQKALLAETRKAATENAAYIKSLGLTAKEVNELTSAEQRANKVMQQTAQIQAKSAQAVTATGAQYKNLQTALGPLSLQAQDFAVQVSMGTSAMTAFAQQAPQFLGGFGAIGAGVGFAVAAIPLAIAGIQAFTGGAEDLDEAMQGVADAAAAVKEAADILVTPLKDLGFLSNEAAQRFHDLTEAQLTLRAASAKQELEDLSKSLSTFSRNAVQAFNDLTAAELDYQAKTNLGTMGAELAKDQILVNQEINRLLTDRAEAMDVTVEQAKALGVTWTAVQKAEAGSVKQQQALIQLAKQRAEFGASFGEELDKELDALLQANKVAAELNNNLAKASIGPDELARMDAYSQALQDASAAAANVATEVVGLQAQADALERGATAEQARQAAQEAITLAKWDEAKATAATYSELQALNAEWATYLDNQRKAAELQAQIKAQEDARRDAEREAQQKARKAEQDREQAAKKAADASKARMDELRGILQGQAPEWLKINAQVDRYNQLMAEAKSTTANLTMNEIDQFLNEQVLLDFQERWNKIRTELSDTGQALVGGFNTFFDEVISGSKSAADAFEDMLLSIAQDIVKFLASKAVQDILLFLADLGGFKWMFANPGMPGSPTGLQAANMNAMPMARAPALIAADPGQGSKMAYVLPPVPIARATAPYGSASGGMGSANVVVNNYTSADVTTTEGTNPAGERVLEIEIRDRVKGLFSSGAMDATMRQNYGIRRKGG